MVVCIIIYGVCIVGCFMYSMVVWIKICKEIRMDIIIFKCKKEVLNLLLCILICSLILWLGLWGIIKFCFILVIRWRVMFVILVVWLLLFLIGRFDIIMYVLLIVFIWENEKRKIEFEGFRG